MEKGFAPVPPKEVLFKVCRDRNQVCKMLNRWIQHGWNLSRHFIKINWIGIFMAQSRIEKFREYRRSIINNEMELNAKTPIETSLETTSTESKVLPSEKEAAFLKKLSFRKNFIDISFIVVVSAIIITLVVFGIILFK